MPVKIISVKILHRTSERLAAKYVFGLSQKMANSCALNLNSGQIQLLAAYTGILKKTEWWNKGDQSAGVDETKVAQDT